jgi:hypothetical protein
MQRAAWRARHRPEEETSDAASGTEGTTSTSECNKRRSQRRGGQDVGRQSSFPVHLSKWSPVLVPGALVQVVARPCSRRTCPSGRLSSFRAHLSKWSPALVLSDTCPNGRPSLSLVHLSKWSPVLVLGGTCPSGRPPSSLATLV